MLADDDRTHELRVTLGEPPDISDDRVGPAVIDASHTE